MASDPPNLLPFAGSPVPEVSWFRDGQVLSAAALPGAQISFSDGRAVLKIPAVSTVHSGRFSVRATNGAGQATSTAELLVTGEGQKSGTSLSHGPEFGLWMVGQLWTLGDVLF